MRFVETPLMGAYVIEHEPIFDERGYFARTFCREAFAERGLTSSVAQTSISFNQSAHTLRGMHYQAPPWPEAKLVACVQGALFDVIVDLRRGSPTFCAWFGVELCAGGGRALFVPEGFAHGFLTLEQGTLVSYQISEAYRPELARGVRWNDPAFGIEWPPHADLVISPRDAGYPDFERGRGGFHLHDVPEARS